MFLRRHFVGEPSGGVAKCQLFSQVSPEFTFYTVSPVCPPKLWPIVGMFC